MFHQIFVHLTLLFNIMLRHGVCLLEICYCQLWSLFLKQEKNRWMPAIITGQWLWEVLLVKYLNNISLEKRRHVLTSSSDLQYGFKAKHSTSDWTFVPQNILEYYISNNSSMFLVLLDASRAFDLVQYVKLFRLLRKPGLCPHTCRILAYMYTNQSPKVNWNGHYSNPFPTSNCMKQGGRVSAILFCVYMDELISRLKQSSGVEYFIGYIYFGSLCWAHDPCLLVPTRSATQIMLGIYENIR